MKKIVDSGRQGGNFSMAEVFRFLKELRENNNREWFHAHKEWYLTVKAGHEDFINRVIPGISGERAGSGRIDGKRLYF